MMKKHVIFGVLLIVALGGISLVSVSMFKWNRPLGTSLELPTITPSVTSVFPISSVSPKSNEQSPISNKPVTTTQAANLAILSTPQPSPIATKQPMCNGPATMTLLVIGADQRGNLYGLADSIYIMYIDFSTPKVMIIDFPRDLWVEIPGISDHYGVTHGKINQAYFFGTPGMGYYDGPGEGPGLLARTLDLNFGLRLDHYLTVDMPIFVRMIDAVGGVDIKVEISNLF